MLKGVTKNVIEINNMENEFFDRAIIILKDSCTIKDEILRDEADLMFKNCAPDFVKVRKRAYRLKMFFCAAAGAGISAAICVFFYMFV